MHSDCIIHDGLLDVYRRLGIDKPHQPDEPSDDGAEKSIDAKPNGTEAAETAETAETKDNVEVAEDGTPTPAPAKEHKVTDTPETATKKRGRPRKSDGVNGVQGTPTRPAKINGKPYEGLFQAALLLDVSPPMLEITDLRDDVKGGKKKWQERIKCLLCGTEVS
jgi:hypothetical protein